MAPYSASSSSLILQTPQAAWPKSRVIDPSTYPQQSTDFDLASLLLVTRKEHQQGLKAKRLNRLSSWTGMLQHLPWGQQQARERECARDLCHVAPSHPRNVSTFQTAAQQII
eukprot:1251112-Amphidinium_carterae.1